MVRRFMLRGRHGQNERRDSKRAEVARMVGSKPVSSRVGAFIPTIELLHLTSSRGSIPLKSTERTVSADEQKAAEVAAQKAAEASRCCDSLVCLRANLFAPMPRPSWQTRMQWDALTAVV
eukprot:1080856-Pleurochrysis_carterae.AAC.2